MAGTTSLPRRWAERLRRDLEIDVVAASTSMEGIPVTVEEVRQILSGRRPDSVSESDAELVRGYRDSMALALGRSSGRSVSSKYYRSLTDVSPATVAIDLAT